MQMFFLPIQLKGLERTFGITVGGNVFSKPENVPIPSYPLETLKILRQVLVPNECVGDLKQWMDDRHRLAMIRRAFLHCSYASTDRFAEAIEKRKTSLPSYDEVLDTFDMRTWSRAEDGAKKDDERSYRQNVLLGGVSDLRRVSSLTSTKRWSLEDCLEAAGADVRGRNEFNAYCESTGTYEFLTVEMIDSLAKYLEAAAGRLSGPVRVLEVGAARGDLTRLLRKRLEDRSPDMSIELVATDKYVARSDDEVDAESVKRLSCEAAVRTYAPQIVLCSWMPMGLDWTSCFRRETSIQEYILIGETDQGCCGDPWKTWGVVIDSDRTTERPPYEIDGFARYPVPAVSKYQLSRYDCEYYLGHSETTSFRRVD